MKIHNIATFGIIAAIFGSTGQALATTIASQAYVDAKDNLKQDKLNAGTGGNVTVDNTSTTAASRAITGITATGNGNITFTTQPISVSAPAATTYVDDGTGSNTVLQLTSSDTKAPSVRAIQAAKQDKQTIGSGQTIANVTQWTSSTTDGDKKFPTVQAVGQQFDKFANANNTVLSSGITSTKVGNYDTAATAVGDAITANAIAAADGYLVKTNAIKNTIAYHKKTDNTHTANLDISGVTGDRHIFGENTAIATKSDDYVPTVAAVEARVLAVEDMIPGGSLAGLNAVSGGTGGTITDDTITNADIKSDAAIALTKLGTLASYSKPNSAGTVATGDSVQTAIGKLDKAIDDKVTANSAITASGTTNKIVQYDTKGLVVAGTTAGDLATLNAVGGGSGGTITDKSVTYNYDMNNTALFDINTGAVPSGDYCTESIPCILTYYKKGGKVYTRWTPMDTESTAVNSATTDAGATI